MKPNEKFLKLNKDFWANIKSISQQTGYTVRGKNQIKVPNIEDIKDSLNNLKLSYEHLILNNNQPTDLGALVIDYFIYRAEILNNSIEPLLMDVDKVKKIYNKLNNQYKPKVIQPLNKQKNEKKNTSISYLYNKYANRIKFKWYGM